MVSWRIVALGVVTELLYLGLYVPTSAGGGVALFIAVNGLAFLPFSMVVRRALIRKAEAAPDRITVWLIVLFGMLFRLTLVPLPRLPPEIVS